MKAQFSLRLAMFSVVLFAAASAFGLGSDYSTNAVPSQQTWPKGMLELVNSTNRVHGFFVNAEDLFFFQGDVAEFNSFLQAYSKIEGIENHELDLHEGVGDAKSPWEKAPRACDWGLYGAPTGWVKLHELSRQGTNSIDDLHAASQVSGYVLKINFWTGGKIAFDQIKVPENVKVVRDEKTK